MFSKNNHRQARMNILILGGSGGIGRALIAVIQQRYPQAFIFATYHRNLPNMVGISWHRVDIMQENDVRLLAESIDDVDWVINAVGALHIDDAGPEKSLRQVESQFFLDSMAINTLPTLLIGKYFLRHFRQAKAPICATVSARVGSIGDNKLGGWYSYRCSKAALNMAIKNISIEWQRSIQKGCIVALHPGTTDTELSKPFQVNVLPEKLFSPMKTAGLLVDVIETLQPSDSGRFIAYDGQDITW